MVQLSNVALAVFITSFSNLESIHKIENFVLQFLFPLGCFLGRYFKLLHVFTDSFKLSLNILKFSFGQFCSFGSSSRSVAFSADISSCFMFSPIVSSSVSTSLSFPSANSALSVALLHSSSCTPSFLVISSSFCSLSLAILVV